jgi:hypothetical protein
MRSATAPESIVAAVAANENWNLCVCVWVGVRAGVRACVRACVCVCACVRMHIQGMHADRIRASRTGQVKPKKTDSSHARCAHDRWTTKPLTSTWSSHSPESKRTGPSRKNHSRCQRCGRLLHRPKPSPRTRKPMRQSTNRRDFSSCWTDAKTCQCHVRVCVPACARKRTCVFSNLTRAADAGQRRAGILAIHVG